jgi:hypothetical protein
MPSNPDRLIRTSGTTMVVARMVAANAPQPQGFVAAELGYSEVWERKAT